MTTVVAGLIQRGGQLLICQRRTDSDFAGKWEFPGGKIEPGETPDGALRRELMEELGIEVRDAREVWRTEYQYPERARIGLLFFEISQFSGEPANRVFQQIGWAAARELENFDFLEADRPLIRMLRTGELRLVQGVWEVTG